MTKKTWTEADIQADLLPFAKALGAEAKRAATAEYGREMDFAIMLNLEGKHVVCSNMDTLHMRILLDEIANLRVHDPELQNLLTHIDDMAAYIDEGKKRCHWHRTSPILRTLKTSCGHMSADPGGKFCPYCGRRRIMHETKN